MKKIYLSPKIHPYLIKKAILALFLMVYVIIVLQDPSLLKSKKIFLVSAVLWIYILSLILIPAEKWKQLKNDGTDKTLHRIFFALSPFFSFWIVERFNDASITKIMETPLYFTLNLLIYTTFLLIAYLLTNSTKLSTLILIIVTFAISCTSYYVNLFRGAPIYPSDFLSIKTAFNVADNYEFALTWLVLSNLLLLVAFCAPIIMVEKYKGMHLRQRLAVLFTILLSFGTIKYVFFDGTFLTEHKIKISNFNPKREYKKYGYAMSFMIQTHYLIPDRPTDYSVENAADIASHYPSDSVNTETKVQPNIICIMNESLSDLNYIGKINTSEEVFPFINSLKENTIKGKLHVSVFGGNTANSEFEFLTGNSMAFLPGRTVAYEFFVRDAMPNLTYNLVSTGYTYNNALHPYVRGNWNREYVYDCMGFSNFIDRSMYLHKNKVRRYISDMANANEIIYAYKETRKTSSAPFYLFNVTMQNHGGYGTSKNPVKESIHFTDDYLREDAAVTEYINLLHLSDQATKRLIEYFKTVEEPTAIVMFGDHMASLGDSIYEYIYGSSLDSLSLEETSRMYNTPYFIWTNYDIPEAENVDMSINYLSSYLLKTLNLPMTGYQKYLMDLYEKLPVVSNICHVDRNGNYYANNDSHSPYKDILNEYHILQYNNVIDYENRIENFFTLDGFTLPSKK